MLFNKFEDYLQHEKKFSTNTISAYLRDLKSFQFFLNQNGDKITKEINYSFINKFYINNFNKLF